MLSLAYRRASIRVLSGSSAAGPTVSPVRIFQKFTAFICQYVGGLQGRTRPELLKMTGIKHRSSVALALKSLTEAEFIEERGDKFWATPKKGRFAIRSKLGTVSPEN